MGAGSGELTLEISRVFHAVLPAVFNAFVVADEMKKWWGPQGFTIPSLDYEPRVGASYRIEMKPPAAESVFLSGEFKVVDPPERLVYSFSWEDPDPDDVPNMVELSFLDLAGSAKVSLFHGPFKTEARRQLLHDGWTESFDKLERVLSES